MSLGNRVKDPQGNNLVFDVTSPCVSGVGEHYTATRTDDPPLYYIVGSGELAPGTEWKIYCWKFCPYSLEWRAHHHSTDPDTGVEIELDGYYTLTVSGERIQYQVTSDKQTTHAGTKGRMAYHQRGRIAGFICVDPDCYYYTTAVSGTYFFQV
jgi:hypothetical protein